MAAMASTGEPCGIVTEAEMTLASVEGMKRKPGRPDSSIPTVTIITATPTDAVTYRHRSAELEQPAVDAMREARQAVREDQLEAPPWSRTDALRDVRQVGRQDVQRLAQGEQQVRDDHQRNHREHLARPRARTAAD